MYVDYSIIGLVDLFLLSIDVRSEALNCHYLMVAGQVEHTSRTGTVRVISRSRANFATTPSYKTHYFNGFFYIFFIHKSTFWLTAASFVSGFVAPFAPKACIYCDILLNATLFFCGWYCHQIDLLLGPDQLPRRSRLLIVMSYSYDVWCLWYSAHTF